MARCLRRRARLGYSVVVKIDAAIVCVLFVGLSFWQPLAAPSSPTCSSAATEPNRSP